MNTIAPETTEEAQRMYAAGAHFALPKERRHPTTQRYLFGLKNKNDIFDLQKTTDLLEKAKAYAKGLGEERKQLLFVGGKPESQRIVKNAATRIGAPFAIGRWIGGTITNFAEIKKRVAKLEKLQADKESGALSKYTKYERLHIDREIDKLTQMYEGLVGLGDRLPDAMFVIDPRREAIAVEEARTKRIPVIALANSDCDLSVVDYPIPANDSARKSIEFFVEEVAGAYEEGKASAPKQVARAPRSAK